MKTLITKIGDRFTLEELFKDNWKETGNWGSTIMLGRNMDRILYDREKGEIAFKYEYRSIKK